MQYCASVQSSFGEVSPILEVDSDIPVAHFSTVEGKVLSQTQTVDEL